MNSRNLLFIGAVPVGLSLFQTSTAPVTGIIYKNMSGEIVICVVWNPRNTIILGYRRCTGYPALINKVREVFGHLGQGFICWNLYVLGLQLHSLVSINLA